MNNLYELFVTHFFTVCHFFEYFALFLEAVVQGCSVKGVFKNSPKFTGQCAGVCFNKVLGL